MIVWYGVYVTGSKDESQPIGLFKYDYDAYGWAKEKYGEKAYVQPVNVANATIRPITLADPVMLK
jgi:hypothetical protein